MIETLLQRAFTLRSFLQTASIAVLAGTISACDSSDKIFGTDTAERSVDISSSNDGGSSTQDGYLGCISGKALGSDTIRINFEFPAKATKVAIYRDGILAAAFTNPLITTYTDYSLSQGRTYLYSCEGIFDGLARRGSRELPISTLLVDPPTFEGLSSATALNANSVLLKWKPATGIPVDHYQVFKKLGSSLDMDVEVPFRQDLPIGTTELAIEDLGDELPYSFGVRACATPVNASEPLCSINSIPTTVVLPNGGAPRTAGATQAVATNGQVTLTAPWSDPMGAVKKRKIYRSITGGTNLTAYTLVQTVDVSIESPDFTDPPISIPVPGAVTEGITYYYIVRDEDSSASNMNSTPVSVRIEDQTPPIFGGILTLDPGTAGGTQQDTVLKATFTAISSQRPDPDGASNPAGASAYLIYKTEKDFPDAPEDPCSSSGVLAGELAAESYRAGATVTTEITSLTPRKNYRVCIKAKDEGGNTSNNINYLTATTWDITAPSFDGIQSLAYSGGQLVATWNPATPSSDVKEYRVKIWKGIETPLPGDITTVVKASPGSDTGFGFASPLSGFTFIDGDTVYVLVDACDKAAIYGGPQNCTSIATTLAKSFKIPDITAPTIGTFLKTGSASLWNLNWTISDNITPNDQLFVKIRKKAALANNDFPTHDTTPFTQGSGLTSITNESGPADTEGFINYLFEVIEPGTNLFGTATYSVAYDNKAPAPATGLGWQQASPVKAMPVTATWTKSASGDVGTQKIRFFSSPDCTTGGGSPISLALTDQERSFEASSEGNYSFQIITTDTSGNQSTACSDSVPMKYDWTAPTVSSVNSSTANGAYTIDNEIFISVAFSEVVKLTGAPRLQLNVGGPIAYANYVSGNNTATLTFLYTVAGGHNSSDLDYLSNTALSLNGGAITDLAGNDAILVLPAPGQAGSLSANKNIAVDTNVPSITILTPATGTRLNATQNVTNYPISGICSEKNNAISLEIGGFPIATTITCGSDNTWSTQINVADLSHSATGTTHTVRVSIVKTVNGALADHTISIIKDVTAPVVSALTLTSPTASPGKDPTPTIEILGVGLASGDQVKVFTSDNCAALSQVASTTSTDATPELTTSELVDADYTFYAQITDAAGNPSSCSTAYVDYLLDRMPPEKPTGLGWVQSSPSTLFTVTARWTKSIASDLGNQKIQFHSDGGCSSPIGELINLNSATAQTQPFTASGEGSYTYQIISYDLAQNPTTSDCSSEMKIDTSGPAIALTTPANGAYINSTNAANYTVSGTCENGGGQVTITAVGSITVTKTAACGGTFSTTMNVSGMADGAGAVAFTATQADGAGNIGTSATNTVSKDTSAPTVAVGAPSATEATGTSTITFPVTYTGSSTRSLTTLGVTLNTTDNASCTKTVTNGTTATPTVTLSACTGSGTIGITIDAGTATDAAGNPSTASAPSATVTVDAQGPTQPGLFSYTPSGNAAGWYNSTSLTPIFNWNPSTDASGVSHYTLAIGTGATGTARNNVVDWFTLTGTTKQFSATLAEGTTYYATVIAYDTRGNTSVPAQTSWRVDSTRPTAPGSVNDGVSKMSQSKSPGISWSVGSDALSGIDHYEVAIGSTLGQTDIKSWTAVGSGTSVAEVTGLAMTANNNYYASVRSVDLAGNISATSGQGDGWLSLLDPCPGADIGGACTGGARYAGTFKGNQYMVLPGGCSFEPGGTDRTIPTVEFTPVCGGGYDNMTKPWNNGTSTYVDLAVENITAHSSPSTQLGDVNTGIIGNSGAAAAYCANVSYGGYTDWYLPSKSEMVYLLCKAKTGPVSVYEYPQEDPHCATIGFGSNGKVLTGFTETYWTSTEAYAKFAWTQSFRLASQNYNGTEGDKIGSHRVRCVRRY